MEGNLLNSGYMMVKSYKIAPEHGHPSPYHLRLKGCRPPITVFKSQCHLALLRTPIQIYTVA